MSELPPNWHLRLAQEADIPALNILIETSVCGLQPDHYTPAQIARALGTVLGLDTQLICDQTYFLLETKDSEGQTVLAGCGGWSRLKTLFCSDHGRAENRNCLTQPPKQPKFAPSSSIHRSPGASPAAPSSPTSRQP